jgi:hypothetical protein
VKEKHNNAQRNKEKPAQKPPLWPSRVVFGAWAACPHVGWCNHTFLVTFFHFSLSNKYKI